MEGLNIEPDNMSVTTERETSWCLRSSNPFTSVAASLEESHGVQQPSPSSPDTLTLSLLTPTHFFLLCICNPWWNLIRVKAEIPLGRNFVIKYLEVNPRGSKPFWRRPSTHGSVCVFRFIWRSGLVQRCSYSMVTVRRSFLHPHEYPSLTLKTNLLLLALSRFRMSPLRVCLAFRFSHSFPLSLPRNLCLAAPLQTLECQQGRGDRFDSNRTMKRTWSNYFQNRVYLGPLLFTLFLSLSPRTLVQAQWRLLI